MQEQIVAKTLAISVTQYVWLREGEVNSLNNLKKRGLIDEYCYSQVQRRHLTDAIKDAFFGENDQTFMIPNFHGEGWLIFDDRRFIAKVHNEENAKRILAALKLYRQREQPKLKVQESQHAAA
jgi:hypothetical protein